MPQQQILIIGAGLSGLLAAQELVEQGHQVTLIDKGLTVGGRLATRAMGPGYADYGAQFFTVRDERFRDHVDRWQAAGLAYIWGHGWSDGSLSALPDDGYPRYAIRGGMNALPQLLANGLSRAGATLLTGRRITKIEQLGTGWSATDETGTRYAGDALILTPPVPQSLALLDAGQIRLTAADQGALTAIAYAPSLCGLFWLEGKIALPAPGALQRPGTDISWVADNRAKGISPDATILTVHASPAYSQRNYDAPEEELLATFQASLQPFSSGRIKTHGRQLKRWRYALPTVIHPERFLHAQGLPPLLFGGDAFGHPRVEGAFLSGLAMAKQLQELVA